MERKSRGAGGTFSAGRETWTGWLAVSPSAGSPSLITTQPEPLGGSGGGLSHLQPLRCPGSKPGVGVQVLVASEWQEDFN